jgi:subtilase family protein/type IX secretion system substrate protein
VDSLPTPQKIHQAKLETKTLYYTFRSLVSFAVLLVCLLSPALAQPPVKNAPAFVRLRGGLVAARRNMASFHRDSLREAHAGHHYYVLAQFDRFPDSIRKVQLAANGIRLFDFVGDRTYLAEVNDDFSAGIAKSFALSGLFQLPPAAKISPRLQAHADEDLRDPDKLIAIGYYGMAEIDQVRQDIVAAGARIENLKLQPPRVLFARVPNTGVLHRLAALPYISYLTSQPVRPRALNYNSRTTHGANILGAPSGRNLYGDGVVVGVGDDADPSSHVDFTGRLIGRTSAPFNPHGTHTTGTVGGGGIVNPLYQGMAPHAMLISQYYGDILANAPTYVTDYDMTLTNNSYTYYDYGCIYDGEYDAFAYTVDAQLYSYPYLTHVFAAGNDGSYTCSPFPTQFATIKSGFQCAKNIVCVGWINDWYTAGGQYTLGAGSSGPTGDNRLKPDIVAGGSAVTSTIPNNGYGQSWGSSMASPAVTGTLALLVQRYRQTHGGADPPSILLKALACNTATDLGNPGPDFLYGFGSLNGAAAADAMDASQYGFASVGDGGTVNTTITIPAGLTQARIMICWADYPAAPYAFRTLVNNLDLTVTDPASVVHHPLVLNADPAHVNDIAVEGMDSLNNTEQIVLDNPAGGTYQVAISGTSVPEGPQPFVLTYQFLQPSVVVQYPYGNETLVPNNTEIVRWNAFDNSPGQFTLEYSLDNGATWTTVSSSIPPNSRMINWIVPDTPTNRALIRVTRNGTSYSGMSTHPFVILGQGNIHATPSCQGYADLWWYPVPGATSYDILQLKGDTMVKVGSTTGTTYLLGDLNRDSSYWLGTRAVNGSTPGLRSPSINVIPSGGPCNMNALDNDYTVDSVIGLASGRLHTSSQLGTATPIRIELRNLGTIPTGSPFTVSYSIDGGSPVTETVNASIAPNDGAYTYSFAAPADLSAQGVYHIRIWVSYPGDPQSGNDTISTVIKQLGNAPVDLTTPYTEGFESAADTAYGSPAMGFTGLDRCDLAASTSLGRGRTFVNSGMCRTGNRCAILDQTPISATSTTDSLTMTFNLSNYTAADQVWLDFYFRNQGNDFSLGGNTVWIRGNDQAAWIPVYALDSNAANIGVYQPAPHIDISGILRRATPAQAISSSFQVRFGEEGYTSANDVLTDGDVDDGYLFDDITLTRALNDIGIIRFIAPTQGIQCALTNATAISVLVKNYSTATATNIPIAYVLNGDTVRETIPAIGSQDSVIYTFTTTADMAAFKSYTITSWVHFTGDSYAANDSAGITLQTSPLISGFPYLEGFETGNGNWFTGGVNSSWKWGAPQKTAIDRAANGNNCWVTNLTGDYNNSELSYLYSPCFDLSSLAKPVLSFSHIFQTEDDCDCDYHWVEYTTDDVNWIRLGAVDTGTNWYDNPTRQAWQLSNTKWHVSSYDIPVRASKVRFRIVMSSDPGTTYEGVAIDDVHVFDKVSVYRGANDSLALPVSGSGWIDFDIGGHRVASIDPNGQDLGLTNVKVFFNRTDSARHDATQYYLGRNLVIRPTNQPAGKVGIRYYFLDSEADSLIHASGCPACTTIADAYRSGVTQFSSPVSTAEEDSTLANDSVGIFQFHVPHTGVTIIPNDNGYYAEYQVTGFSEFWINALTPADSAYLPPMTLTFTAVAAGNNALLQWTTTDAMGISRYIIEKSTDSIHFSALDSVPAEADGNGIASYEYTDTHLDTGYNYYRLLEVQQNGSFSYSPVRVVKGPGGGIGIYPNPIFRHTPLYVSTTSNTRRIRLFDVSGRTILNMEVRGTLNIVPLGSLAPGIYFVRVETDSGTAVQKILIK